MKRVIPLLFLIFLLWQLILHWPNEFLKVVLCDVGQGDAILLSYGSTQLLIDTGPDESVLTCLDKQLPFWDKKIDVLVLTHFDDDHIGGFAQLTELYQIAYLFLPLTEYKDSEVFLELKSKIIALQESGTIVKEPFLGQQIAFSKISHGYQAKYNSINNSLLLSFLTPFEFTQEEFNSLEEATLFLWQKPENNLSAQNLENLAYKNSDNNGSIAIFAQFGEVKLLLLGDLESTREVALLSNGLITEVDIQKVGHHGSNSSSSQEFLSKTRPEIALISCGLNNQFHHPNEDVLSRFLSINSQILRSDQLGTIVLLSDGHNFWFKEQKTLSFLNMFH